MTGGLRHCSTGLLRAERAVRVVVLAFDAPAPQDHVRQRVAAHAYPREVQHFVPSLPITATGKIMRGVLRRQFSQETA